MIARRNDPDDAIRSFVIWGLGKIGDTRAVESLLIALEDATHEVSLHFFEN